jgi:hypothetical protein
LEQVWIVPFSLLPLSFQDATEGMPDQTKPHWQWEAEMPDGSMSMMFNTDFEIFFDLGLDSDGKASCILDPQCYTEDTCGKDNICGMAETYGQGLKYISVGIRSASFNRTKISNF